MSFIILELDLIKINLLENGSKICKTMCIQFNNECKSQKRLNLQKISYTNTYGFELG